MRPRVKPAQALPPLWPYVGCDGCVGAGAAGLFVALVSTGFGLPVSEDVLLVSLGSRLGAMRPATLDFSVCQYNILAGYLGDNRQPWFLYGIPLSTDRRSRIMTKFYERDENGKYANPGWPRCG